MDVTRSRLAETGQSRPRLTSRRKADIIEARRHKLIAELAWLRAGDHDRKFTENALQLLTRWWAKANWNAREKLLNDASWLIRLERQRQVQTAR